MYSPMDPPMSPSKTLSERLDARLEQGLQPSGVDDAEALNEMAQSEDAVMDGTTSSMSMMPTDGLDAMEMAKNFLERALTEAELEIMHERIAEKQNMFAEFERREFERKAVKIRECFNFLTDEEIRTALKLRDESENAVILAFTEDVEGFLHEVRRAVALEHSSKEQQHPFSMDQHEALVRYLDSRSNDPSKKKKVQRVGRLKLEDALAQVKSAEEGLKAGDTKQLPQGVFEGWSEARIKAFRNREKNPNAYYYRFNEPGETQRTGNWTKEEQDLFFARLKEKGANGQWGIFSMSIPGRVGYQCSNFYRMLIETRQIEDPNYVLDSKGKAHYKFNTRLAKIANGEDADGTPAKGKKGGKRRKKNADSDDEDYGAKSWGTTKRTRSARGSSVSIDGATSEIEFEDAIEANPLPKFMDPITLEEVVRPTISPYGHVMGYETWMRCMFANGEVKKVCPLTKQPLTKRELVELTWDNIDQYRDKIVNASYMK